MLAGLGRGCACSASSSLGVPWQGRDSTEQQKSLSEHSLLTLSSSSQQSHHLIISYGGIWHRLQLPQATHWLQIHPGFPGRLLPFILAVKEGDRVPVDNPVHCMLWNKAESWGKKVFSSKNLIAVHKGQH